MCRRKICWSNLPSELLSEIGNRLETRPDILNFRAVCKDWHRSLSLSRLSGKNVLSLLLPHNLSTTNPPLLKYGAHLRYETFRDETSVNSLILVASSIFLVKPICDFDRKLLPWLVTVEELNPGKLCVRRPFTRGAVGNLPDYVPNVLELSKFEVEEMGKVYSLRFGKKPNHLFEEEHKVLLLDETRSKIDDCFAVVLYDNGKLSVINLKDENVQEVFVKTRYFDDIVVFNGMVYVIDRLGMLYLMDNNGGDRFKMVEIMSVPLKSRTEIPKSRLVESCGELYLVRKCLTSRPSFNYRRMGLRVYKLNQEKNTWDELDSIGNHRILFVTPDCCFFAPTTDFFEWKGNCIVIHSRDSFHANTEATSYEYGDGHRYDEYMERAVEKLSIDVFHFEECKFEAIESNPSYSVVFWPPPQWISPDTSLPKRSTLEQTQIEDTAQIEDTRLLNLLDYEMVGKLSNTVD